MKKCLSVLFVLGFLFVSCEAVDNSKCEKAKELVVKAEEILLKAEVLMNLVCPKVEVKEFKLDCEKAKTAYKFAKNGVASAKILVGAVCIFVK